MKANRQAVRCFVGSIAALCILLVTTRAPVLADTVVAVQSQEAPTASSIDVCVAMSGSGGKVSGIQMNMNWDSQCLQITKGRGDEGSCTKGPDTGRDTFKTRVQGNSMKVIMLSISDTTPMPDNIQLFCCSFLTADSITGSRECAVNLADVIASDPTGQRLPVSGRPGIMKVNGSSSRSGGSGGSGGGPAGGAPPLGVPAVVIPGQAPAGAGGQAAPAAAAPGGAPAAGSAPAGGLPAVPAMPAMPGVPPIPGAEDVPAAAATGLATVQSTPHAQRTGTAAHSPAAAGTSTPKAQGTPTHAAKHTGPAGTPTPKAKEE